MSVSERRRQRKLSNDAIPLPKLIRTVTTTKMRRRKGKKFKTFVFASGHAPTLTAIVVFVLFVVATVAFVISNSLSSQNRVQLLTSLYAKHTKLKYQSAYDNAFRNKGKARLNRFRPNLIDTDSLSTNSYGSLRTECSLTVLLLDPRIAAEKQGSPIWFALESVAMHTNADTCFALLTSSCIQDEVQVFQRIYSHALPYFRHAFEDGRVRVTFLDHAKYQMDSCDYFNPNAAFLNKHFWVDEFLDKIDSDLVLVMQADTVLCQDLNLHQYQPYAWVGAVWPQQATPEFPEPMEGMCRAMPARWKSWLRRQRQWEKQQEGFHHEVNGSAGEMQLAEPFSILPSAFPPICRDGIAPIGNGGLSLRRRSWMIRAIEACPHAKYSAHNLSLAGCHVLEKINEDFYFGIVLRGIQAPLPTAYEASVFASETLWPEDVLDSYYGAGSTAPYHISRDGTTPRISFHGRTLTVPGGFHKPWAYQSKDLLCSNQLNQACPLLKYILPES